MAAPDNLYHGRKKTAIPRLRFSLIQLATQIFQQDDDDDDLDMIGFFMMI